MVLIIYLTALPGLCFIKCIYLEGNSLTARIDLRRGKGRAGRQDKVGAYAADDLSGVLKVQQLNVPHLFKRRIK
jgi:hypothetical protein